jgi:hypothetical protein
MDLVGHGVGAGQRGTRPPLPAGGGGAPRLEGSADGGHRRGVGGCVGGGPLALEVLARGVAPLEGAAQL